MEMQQNICFEILGLIAPTLETLFIINKEIDNVNIPEVSFSVLKSLTVLTRTFVNNDSTLPCLQRLHLCLRTQTRDKPLYRIVAERALH
jgi:hypothetical protein